MARLELLAPTTDSVALEDSNSKTLVGLLVQHKLVAACLGRNLPVQHLHSELPKLRTPALVVERLAKSQRRLAYSEVHLQALLKLAVVSLELLGRLALAEHKIQIRDSVPVEAYLVIINNNSKSQEDLD